MHKRQCLVDGCMMPIDEGCAITLAFNRPSCLYFNRFWLETTMVTPPGHDPTSSFTPSLDGRGGADLASKDGKSTKRTGLNYGVPYSESSTPGFNGLIYSCSILPSVYQARRIRINSPPLPQRPFHWSHSNEIFRPSSYGGVYQAVPVHT